MGVAALRLALEHVLEGLGGGLPVLEPHLRLAEQRARGGDVRADVPRCELDQALGGADHFGVLIGHAVAHHPLSPGLGPLGLMEADPLLIQAEEKLIGQADELIVLIDSSKFENRSSLILCQLDRIDIVVTDEGVSDRAAAMLDAADVKLIVASVDAASQTGAKIASGE